MNKYVFFGAGSAWHDLKSLLAPERFPVALLDNSNELHGSLVDGIPVYSPSVIGEMDIDGVVVGGQHAGQMCAQLVELGFPREKIVIYGLASCDGALEEIKQEHAKTCHFLGIDLLPVGIGSVNILELHSPEYKSNDWCRYTTLRLAAEEVRRRNLSGSMAELGVYQGNTASFLNHIFPGKKLYLFDTFEGFFAEDVKLDSGNGFSVSHEGQFSDTSVDIVLAKMKNPEVVSVCKGYFPGTVAGIEDEFSIVSLDVDLFSPTKAGLEYFYPRLQSGGYLFIHDYNNRRFAGVKAAVDEYMREYGYIPFLPIPDNCGSIVVCKA